MKISFTKNYSMMNYHVATYIPTTQDKTCEHRSPAKSQSAPIVDLCLTTYYLQTMPFQDQFPIINKKSFNIIIIIGTNAYLIINSPSDLIFLLPNRSSKNETRSLWCCGLPSRNSSATESLSWNTNWMMKSSTVKCWWSSSRVALWHAYKHQYIYYWVTLKTELLF